MSHDLVGKPVNGHGKMQDNYIV